MSTFSFSGSPALRLAGLVIAGILVDRWVHLSMYVLVASLLAVTLLCLLEVVTGKFSTSAALLVSLLGVLLGATKYEADRDRSAFIPRELFGKEVVVVGEIVEPPLSTKSSVRFVMKARAVRSGDRHVAVRENVKVTLKFKRGEASPLVPAYGMLLALRGTLSHPSDTRNPGDFSEKSYLESNGISSLMLVRGSEQAAVLDTTRGSWLAIHAVIPVREYFVRVFGGLTHGESAEFLKGLIVGDRSGISVETRKAFVHSGVAHVLAVSGSHVVIVAGVLFFLFGLLRLPKWGIALSTILGLGVYALVTGGHPPVVRASITASIFLLGNILRTRSDPFNSLGVAALVILAIDARQLFDVGFQLSFVAVLSIVYLYPKMNALISLIPKANLFQQACIWTLRVCAVSLAASLGTLPLTAVYFGKVSLIGVAANIVVMPAVGGAIVLGFVTVLANLVSTVVASSYAAVNQLLLECTLWVIRWSGSISFAYADTSRFLPVYALPFYAALLFVFNLKTPRIARRWLLVFLVMLNVAIFAPQPAAVAATNKLRVAFLDVGQGDGAVIESPEGKVIVIDAGPSAGGYDAGERTMAPYLRRRNISRIDMLIVSHPHDDHIGGVPHILEQFDVSGVMESGQPVKSWVYKRYLSDLHSEGCSVDTARSGMPPVSLGNLRLYVLSPRPSLIEPDTTRRHPNLNNTSVVVRLQYGNVSFLFAGDAEQEVERMIVEQYGEFLGSTLLKTGHHGSKTSSTQEFLVAVRPAHAVVSVGRYNKFKHPSRDVLSRLRSLNAEVYRTDEEGALIFESDGQTLSLVDWK